MASDGPKKTVILNEVSEERSEGPRGIREDLP